MQTNLKQVIKNAIILPCVLLMFLACSHFKHGPVDLADQSADRAAKQFIVPDGQSNIYVVFMGGYSSSYRNFPVTINGILHGFLSDGTFMQISVAPGNYSIISSSPENQQLVEVQTAAGGNYFFGMNSEIAWRDLQVKLQELGQTEGREAVMNAHLVQMPKYLQASPK